MHGLTYLLSQWQRQWEREKDRVSFFLVINAAAPPMMQCIKKPAFRRYFKNLLRIIFISLFILCGYIFRFFFLLLLGHYFVLPLNWHFMVKNGPSVVCEPPILCTQLSLWQSKKKMEKENANGKYMNVEKLFIVAEKRENGEKKHGIKEESRRTIKSFVLFMWCIHAFESRKKPADRVHSRKCTAPLSEPTFFGEKPNGNNIIINLLSFVSKMSALKCTSSAWKGKFHLGTS